MQKEFWEKLDTLVAQSKIVIDRAQGTVHPRYSEYIYPYDYGYLEGTTSSDGDSIDCWVGALEKKVTGIAVTVDLEKKDSEIKILIGCSPEEMDVIGQTHNRGTLSAIVIQRHE